MQAAVAIGSNLGDRRGFLFSAIQALERHAAITVLQHSSFRDTEPVGGPPQGPYLNGVILIATELEPESLLQALLDIEIAHGRQRSILNAPRTLDLDLVLYGDLIHRSANLSIPHPRAHERRFVLEPLAEVAPDWVHPVLGQTIEVLLQQLNQRACS